MSKTSFSKEQALYVYKKFRDVTAGSSQENGVFKKAVTYIRDCLRSHDCLTRVIIEDDAIYFGHSLREIEASFPAFAGYALCRFKPLKEKHVIDYGFRIFLGQEIRFLVNSTRITEQQIELQSKAGEYFANLSPKKCQVEQERLQSLDNPIELLTHLLENHNVLALGELHHHQASKKFMIDHMATLKENGVGIIYLEHVFFDTQKELFDAYFSSDSLTLPAILRDYLQSLDRGFRLSDDGAFTPYSFTGLVVQAKRYGIRIVPTDTRASYETGSALNLSDEKDPCYRSLMMNYVAAMRYLEHDPQQKAIYFVGSAHINAVNSGVPGIQEITGAATLVIENEVPVENKFTAETHIAKPDVLIYLKPELSPEAQQLIIEYADSMATTQARRAALLATPVVLEETIAPQDNSETINSANSSTNPSKFLSVNNRFFIIPNKTMMIGGAITTGLVIGTIISHFLLGSNIAIAFMGFAMLAALATFLINASFNNNQLGMS